MKDDWQGWQTGQITFVKRAVVVYLPGNVTRGRVRPKTHKNLLCGSDFGMGMRI